MGFHELELGDKQVLVQAVTSSNADMQGSHRPRREATADRGGGITLPVSQTSAESVVPRALASNGGAATAATGGSGAMLYPVQDGAEAPEPPGVAGEPQQGSTPNAIVAPTVDEVLRNAMPPRQNGADTDDEMPGLVSSSSAPVSERDESSDSEDEPLDEWEEDHPHGETFEAGMEWWKGVPYESALGLECATSSFVPEGVGHAVATLKA